MKNYLQQLMTYLFAVVNNLSEFLAIKRRPANKASVDVGLAHNVDNSFRSDAAAILNPHLIPSKRMFFFEVAKTEN